MIADIAERALDPSISDLRLFDEALTLLDTRPPLHELYDLMRHIRMVAGRGELALLLGGRLHRLYAEEIKNDTLNNSLGRRNARVSERITSNWKIMASAKPLES